jgi:hypothetical protein
MEHGETVKTARRSTIALLLLAQAGCYTLAPIEMPAPGTDVRARLRIEAAVRRSASIDEPIRHIDGRVVEATPDTVLIDVLVARSQTQFENIVIRDTVRLASSEIESLMERKLSVGKSVLASVIVLGGTVAIVTGISQVVGGNEEDPPGNGTNNILVPLLRVRGLRLSIPPFGWR